MELGFIAFTAFMIGTIAGLGIGRIFCKWHHKKDEANSNKLDGRYNPLEDTEDVCGPVRGFNQQGMTTIGDELKSVRNCKCSPGCGVENCCGDDNCGRCSE